MKPSNTIQRILALLLLLLAVFSSTPKKYLHDAIAHHTDTDFGFRQEGKAFTATAYNCGFDHQVATAPYIGGDVVAEVPVRSIYCPSFNTLFYTDPVVGFRLSFIGRGPPESSYC